MKLAILYSGGKDSTLAMHKASEDNEIVCLITMHSENKDSYMFHSSNIHLTELQAQALEIPLINFNTHGKKELELTDLKDSIKKAKDKFKFQGIVTGALFSDYQASRIGKICEDLELKCLNPLWHLDPVTELNKLLQLDFEVMIIQVAAEGFDESWLGRKIDQKTIDDLIKINKKNKINITAEGGEYESLVLNCPMFKKRISIKKAHKISESKSRGNYIIESAELVNK